MNTTFRQLFLIKFVIAIFGLTFLTHCSILPLGGPSVDPLRFQDLIDEYGQADSLEPPLKNAVLFVGSSSIQGWKSLKADFPEIDVINRGMGGSHMSDLNYYLDDVVFAYQPNAIVVYEGDNDIASGKSPKRVYKDFTKFMKQVRAKWPKLPIFFISIKPSIARVGVIENMAEANALIKTYIESQDNLYYVDVFTPMLDDKGQPRTDIFGHDGLHMNATGYALWTRVLKKEMGIE
jgi:lysophospholipase L1-like esterase